MIPITVTVENDEIYSKNGSSNKKLSKILLVFHLCFDKITKPLIFMLRISFLIRLLKKFLIVVADKNNKIKNNNSNVKIELIKWTKCY